MGNKYEYKKSMKYLESKINKQMPHRKQKRKRNNNEDEDTYEVTISFVYGLKDLFMMGFSTYAFYKAFTIEDNSSKFLCAIIGVLIVTINVLINNDKNK